MFAFPISATLQDIQFHRRLLIFLAEITQFDFLFFVFILFLRGFILKETSQASKTQHDNQRWKAYDHHQNKKCL